MSSYSNTCIRTSLLHYVFSLILVYIHINDFILEYLTQPSSIIVSKGLKANKKYSKKGSLSTKGTDLIEKLN